MQVPWTCRRQAREVVVLSTLWLSLGILDGRLSDGTGCRVQRLPDGRWQAYLRGVELEEPLATWEEAGGRLGQYLADEQIALRYG